MLELRNISVEIEDNGETKKLLNDVSADYLPGSFCALIGPSGCGKSTLIKSIAGMLEPSAGAIYWEERNLDEVDFAVGEMAYVPQFSIAHEALTVAESIHFAIRLRVFGLSETQRRERVNQVLSEVGLNEFSDRPVRVLSGGQRRRLALALELLSQPALLLCDEVTSGLDPHSESEIVQLLANLAHQSSRIVLSVTHSLRHIELYDTVSILYQGRLAFHGAPIALGDYFQITALEDVYDRLIEQPADGWAEQWRETLGLPAPKSETEESS